MKAMQVSDCIWSLKTWVGFPIRVWVVAEEEGVTLVDAGLSIMANGILRFIDRLQAGPLLRIVLTHGHPDHIGAIKPILKTKNVPVYAHPIEIPYIDGDRPYPLRKKAASVIGKGIVQSLRVEEDGHIQSIGGITPYLTPGHSPGHVVYYHESDHVLLAGDLFTSKRGKLHRPMPMFTADMSEAIQSSSIVRHLQPKRLEVCHGEPVFQAADHLDAYIAKTSQAFATDMP